MEHIVHLMVDKSLFPMMHHRNKMPAQNTVNKKAFDISDLTNKIRTMTRGNDIEVNTMMRDKDMEVETMARSIGMDVSTMTRGNEMEVNPMTRGIAMEVDNWVTENMMKQRIQTMNDNCQRLHLSSKYEQLKAIWSVLKINHTCLCKVPKCGITFWTTAILTMTNKVNYEEFQHLDRQQISFLHDPSTMFSRYKPEVDDSLVFFARNPWKRLYSAYIDKIYRLQLDFIPIIREILKKNKAEYCGEVPSFQEFLDSIVSNNHFLINNNHWKPIKNLCNVCMHNYTYMIKMETFVPDSMYLLDKIMTNNTPKKQAIMSLLLDDFSTNSVRQMARQFTYEGGRLQNNCTSFLDVMTRLWISLQTQGFISENIPFNSNLFTGVSFKDIVQIEEIFLSASNSFVLSESKRKEQKRKYFRQAYSNIKLATLYAIRNIYEDDFRLFGYDMKVPFI